ncbi:MAG: ABC transporter permease [Caldilineaceae bacterium]|nr:ABC transporter permease [Caldilineaceae bacterium]
MDKIWLIAWHEYRVNVRRPGFIIMTLLIPLLGLVALLIGAFFGGQAGDALVEVFAGSNRSVAVVDQSGRFTPILPEYADGFRLFASEEAGVAAVQAETARRLIVIPADYVESGRIRVVSGEGAFSALDIEDSGSLRGFFVDHLVRDVPDAALRARLANPFRAQVVNLSGEEQSAGGVLASVLGFIVPYMLSILLIVTIFVSSGYLLRSVSEEKTNRVIEIVLSSVTAQQLLAGKVIGLGALGLTQVIVWVGSSFGLSGGIVALLGVAVPLFARPEVFVLAVVYYLLGFVVYAVLMGSVGALGADFQESQQLAGVFSLLASVPLMLAGVFFTNPNSGLIRFISWFPLTAPTAMMLRLPMTEVPVIDIVGSLATILLTIPLIVWLGGKVFRLGLLMYGKRPKLGEIWRLLREA